MPPLLVLSGRCVSRDKMSFVYFTPVLLLAHDPASHNARAGRRTMKSDCQLHSGVLENIHLCDRFRHFFALRLML